MKGNWFVAELEDGKRLRGRMQMEAHAKSGMYPFKVDVHWQKSEDETFDLDMTAKFEEQLMYVFEKEKDAFLTMVTEDDKEFVFSWYVRNIQAFGTMLNNTLMLFPPLPLTLYSMDDPEWLAYNNAYKVVNCIN